MRYRELGLIGRFQPPHKGHEMLLRAAAAHAERLRIGIGSVNRHDETCPFLPYDTERMLRLIIDGTGIPYRIVRVPDYGHLPGCEDGSCWRERVRAEFDGVDAIVTGNPYVAQLLSREHRIIAIDELLAPGARMPICGSLVRSAMALGYGWEDLVPTSVRLYLHQCGLDERLREEFGDALARRFPVETETVDGESRKVRSPA